jgi:hypothetical protein
MTPAASRSARRARGSVVAASGTLFTRVRTCRRTR